ncbi:MAG: phenylalanine--tRNA ligase beta subunit-related protein [Proteobacteria bacterium]|nr:phenylalanine--tRNA ligase beta subunit-related protein [Pseudomonadota bacterium]
MIFSVEDKLFSIFPELKIGVLVCEIENKRYGEDRFEAILEDIRTNFPYKNPQEHLHVKVWRDAFNKLGISASKYYSSIESLLRRILKGGPFPRISPVVDLYNEISLKYLVPMGGHAIVPIEGDISLCFAEGNETFIPMEGGEPEIVGKGEVVYKDEKEVLTRRWVWRQCNKDKVTVDTTSVFIPIDVMEGLSEGLCGKIMDDMEHGLLQNGYGRVVHKDIITRNRLYTQFSI